jgi:hypothetical protein
MAERSSLGVSRAQDGRSERPATEVGDSDPKLRSLHVCPAGQASGLVINSTILSPHVRARPLHARLRHRAAPGLAIFDRWSLARHPAWRSTQQSFHHMSVHGHFTPGCGIVPPRAWRSSIAGRWPGIRPGDQLNNPFTTCPCTSVSLKSRPWERKVRRSWSRPRQWRIVAWRSCTCTSSRAMWKPSSSVSP